MYWCRASLLKTRHAQRLSMIPTSSLNDASCGITTMIMVMVRCFLDGEFMDLVTPLVSSARGGSPGQAEARVTRNQRRTSEINPLDDDIFGEFRSRAGSTVVREQPAQRIESAQLVSQRIGQRLEGRPVTLGNKKARPLEYDEMSVGRSISACNVRGQEQSLGTLAIGTSTPHSSTVRRSLCSRIHIPALSVGT